MKETRHHEKEKKILSLLSEKLDNNSADKFRVYYFDEATSTMDIASRLSINELGALTIVVVDRQMRGRGRFSRSWFSTSNDLTLSIVLKDYLTNIPYSLISSYSAYHTLIDYGAEIYLKWVNDIYWINGKKIGGVLLEDKGDRLIIGMGINLNTKKFPAELKDKATSYYLEKNVEINKQLFLVDLVCKLDFDLLQLNDKGPEELLAKWEEASIMRGKFVRVETRNRSYEGVCIGIDKKTGYLILRIGDEITEIFDAESVSVRPLLH